MRDLAFALIWLAMLPMSFMSAYVGILLWIWVAMLSPGYSLYGIMSGVPFNKMVALTTAGIIVVKKDKKDFYVDSTLVTLGLLLAVATISWLSSLSPSDEGTDLYQKLLKEIVLVVAITGVMHSRNRIHVAMVIITVSIGFFSVSEGLQFLLTAGGHKILGVPSIGDNNSLAAAVLMIVPLLAYLARYSSLRAVRLTFLAVLALSVLCVIGTYSRGGFVGMVALALFMIAKSKNRTLSLVIVLLGAAAIYFTAPDSWFDRLHTIDADADHSDNSFLSRVFAWKVSTMLALDRPLIGGGPHAIQRYMVWNAFRNHVGLLDFIKTPIDRELPMAAHSIWFEILGDLGFTGLILFVTVLGMAFWNCRKIVKMAVGHPSVAWAADLARMLQVSLAMYAITASALSMGYFELFYILVAFLSRLRRTVRQTIEAEAGVPVQAGARLPVVMPRPALDGPIPGRYARTTPTRPIPARTTLTRTLGE